MFTCPNCNVALRRVKTDTGIFFACPQCCGRAGGIAMLRRVVHPECLRGIWRQAIDPQGVLGKRCPICHRPTRQVRVALGGQDVQIDVCTSCQFIWFDALELERFPSPPPAPVERPLPEKVRELLAIERLRLDALTHSDDETESPPEEWQWLPAAFGLPVELDAPEQATAPYVTLGLTAALVLVFVATMNDVGQAFKDFGLLPAQPFRDGGMTFLTSFFIHAGWFHLVSNAYFLLVFGRYVEEYLGWARYAILLLAATVFGGLLHVLLDIRPQIPCGGASGGISGLLIFYALKFPRARLGILLRYYWRMQWLNISAVAALGIWILLQLVGACVQLHGEGSVSSLGHLGGALFGVAAWWTWHDRPPTQQ